jgi:hypothetical protein
MSENQPSAPPKPEYLTPEEVSRASGESQSTQPKQVKGGEGGPSAAEAAQDASSSKEPIGEGYSPPPE